MALCSLDCANRLRTVPGWASAGSVAPITSRSFFHRGFGLEHQRDGGSGGYEYNQRRVEGTLAVHCVEFPGRGRVQPDHADRTHREPAPFQVRQDLAGGARLHRVWLDDGERMTHKSLVVYG